MTGVLRAVDAATRRHGPRTVAWAQKAIARQLMRGLMQPLGFKPDVCPAR